MPLVYLLQSRRDRTTGGQHLCTYTYWRERSRTMLQLCIQRCLTGVRALSVCYIPNYYFDSRGDLVEQHGEVTARLGGGSLR